MTLWFLWSTDDRQDSSAYANDKHHKAINYLIINLSIIIIDYTIYLQYFKSGMNYLRNFWRFEEVLS